MADFGDRDSTYLEQYRKALFQDDAVIGIAVQDEREAAKVGTIPEKRRCAVPGLLRAVVEVLEP